MFGLKRIKDESDNMAIEKSIEKHSIKISIGVAITVILFLLTMTAQFTRWQTEMEAHNKEFDDRISHVGEKVVGMRADINELKIENIDVKVRLATIETKLTNIESLLLEIHNDIKERG